MSADRSILGLIFLVVGGGRCGGCDAGRLRMKLPSHGGSHLDTLSLAREDRRPQRKENCRVREVHQTSEVSRHDAGIQVIRRLADESPEY